ncbi:MAG: DEAD/DEAH box helicase [Candidatus Saccharicenans sp.]
MNENDSKIKFSLSDKEKLTLQQLEIRAFLENYLLESGEIQNVQSKPISLYPSDINLPNNWQFTKGIKLYDWQKDALKKWFEAGKKGTFKVVTGAGKTILALAAIEKLQNEEERNLRVAIIVPTIILMEQWYKEILEKGNIPPKFVGRLGGRYQDNFTDKRIIVAVLASASKKLADIVNKAGIGSKLFLIVDECHRAGAEEMSRVFEVERAFIMGLSATPEREDEVDESGSWLDYENTLLGKNIGPVLLELTYEDALKFGLIPPFTIKHYALPLTPEEQYEYDELTRSIKDTKSNLLNYVNRDKYGGSIFYRWAQRMAQQDKGEISQLAKKYVANVAKRKMLLYRMNARKDAVIKLINQELKRNSEARILLFHESIKEATYLFLILYSQGFPVLLEHSELPEQMRLKNIELFRQGICKVLVSVKSLIEGFNVPAVDVGIIVASSTAVRQRIQSMGRVMRAYKDSTGKEKTSLIHILYARNTVDEEIYAKYNWDKFTGLDRNIYYHWDVHKEPVEIGRPPKQPPPTEDEIDENQLKPGAEYPGEYEGLDYSCDNSHNIKDMHGNYILGMGDLAEKIIKIKGTAGKFKITPKKHFVLVQKKSEESWDTIYITKLDALPTPSLTKVPVDSTTPDQKEIENWLKSASPGDKYPFIFIPLKKSGLIFSMKRGGVIVKKVSTGEVYARQSDNAIDKNKGLEAENLIKRILSLRNQGEFITRLEINELNHVLYIKNGVQYFIMPLSCGLEFPE